MSILISNVTDEIRTRWIPVCSGFPCFVEKKNTKGLLALMRRSGEAQTKYVNIYNCLIGSLHLGIEFLRESILLESTLTGKKKGRVIAFKLSFCSQSCCLGSPTPAACRATDVACEG